MPLPAGGAAEAWPPADCAKLHDEARAWRAWWSGDLNELIATAGTDIDSIVQTLGPNQRRFNVSQLIRRRFWQRRQDSRDVTVATRPAHAPLASDIAVTSADLLFGEAPDLTIPPTMTADGSKPKKDKNRDAVQARLEQLIDQLNLWSRFLEGAEACAATGGVYLRCVVDAETAPDRPLSTVVDQVHAVPDFRFGQLVAVTFWEEVRRDGSTVWRHLERHEPGMVLHGLYEGTETALGSQVDLADDPHTARFKPAVPNPAGLPHPLLVAYVPNVLPNRRHRAPVGRSDYAGAEDFLDLLDELWTSLGRDFRIGQARVVTPIEFLQSAGTRPGDGKTMDVDTELFTGLNIADLDKLSDPLKFIQPLLRVGDHNAAIEALVKAIVSAAGYSPQTFGLDIQGQAEAGTALRIREKKTAHTVQRKRGYWTAAITEHVEQLLALDAALFNGPGSLRPTLDWPEFDDDPAERATTTAMWRNAEAISTEQAVKARNPRWTQDQVDEEVAKIEGEQQAKLPTFADLPEPGKPGAPKDPGGQQPAKKQGGSAA